MSYRNILIVHPSHNEREVLKKYATSGLEQIVVTEAQSAQDANALIKQQNFDIILTSLVLSDMIRLETKTCHVIFMIPDESQEHLDLIKKHNIKHFQVNPKNKEALQDNLNGITRNRIFHQHPRYDVIGGSLELKSERLNKKGVLLNISEAGFLCDVVIPESDLEYIKNHQLTVSLTFPRNLGGSHVRKLKCNYLAVRKTEKQGNKLHLTLVFLLLDITGSQKRKLDNVFQKAERRRHPLLCWKNNRLELTTNGVTHFFYRIHLLRIFLLILFITISSIVLIRITSEEQVKIIWQNGIVLTKQDTDDMWQAVNDDSISEDLTIGIQAPDSPSQKSANETFDPFRYHAVLRYKNQETVFLSNNGTISRKVENNYIINYQLTGAIHLISNETETSSLQHSIINGLAVSSTKHHLFFIQHDRFSELFIVSGNLILLPKQSLFLSLAADIKPVNSRLVLDSGKKIRFVDNKVIVETNKSQNNKYYDRTFLPGFMIDGPFNQIGIAQLEKGSYQLTRYGKTSPVRIKKIPIMDQDQIRSTKLGKLLITFETGDIMRVYPDSEIKITEFQLASKFPFLPLVIGVNEQTLIKPKQQTFVLNGRVRLKVAKKTKHRRIKIRTAQAIVGVRGTDFETNSNDKKTQVLTVNGNVNLSDLELKHTVEINRGMMSTIQKGSGPSKPVKIPKSLLLSLLSDSIDKVDQFSLSNYNNIDFKRIELISKSPVSLFWNAPIASAQVHMAGKTYPIKIKKGSPELVLKWSNFLKVSTGKHSALIRVIDEKGRISKVQTTIHLLPFVKMTMGQLIFDGKIQFEKEKAEIKPESLALLQEITNQLKSLKNIISISIEGHTDSNGQAEYNLSLSKERAEAVKNYLIDQGVPKELILATGYGESKPISGNETEVGQEENRRVEFIIQQSKKQSK